MNLSAEWRRLRELDWRELDIKEAGGWPWSLQLACCLLVLGLTCFAMDWYLAAPKVEALEQEVADPEDGDRDEPDGGQDVHDRSCTVGAHVIE